MCILIKSNDLVNSTNLLIVRASIKRILTCPTLTSGIVFTYDKHTLAVAFIQKQIQLHCNLISVILTSKSRISSSSALYNSMRNLLRLSKNVNTSETGWYILLPLTDPTLMTFLITVRLLIDMTSCRPSLWQVLFEWI